MVAEKAASSLEAEISSFLIVADISLLLLLSMLKGIEVDDQRLRMKARW